MVKTVDPKGKIVMFTVSEEWPKNLRLELKDCIRCENCDVVTLLTWDEYLADAAKGRFWTCGNCGRLVDPYEQDLRAWKKVKIETIS